MIRVVVVVSVVLFALCTIAGSAQCMPPAKVKPSCAPPPFYVTKLVPCVKTEMVGCVKPCTGYVPVKMMQFRCQRYLLKGIPVGRPQGGSPCIKCYPQPFCQVVERKVPCVTWAYKPVKYYNVCYKPVCRQVWLPQTYQVQPIPLGCR
jgi:hypothetical protein